MKDLEMKINDLADKIAEMKKKTESSTRIAAIVYVVLVIFVFIYTSTIMSMLKQKATADSISAQLRITLEERVLTAENRQKLLDKCREKTPEVADALVQMTHDEIIPGLKDQIKNLLDKQVDGIIVRLEKDVYPEINKIIKAHAEELKKHSDLTDEQVAKEIAGILAKDCDREMSKFINDKLRYRMGKLKEELDKVSSKPYKSLTAKEAAERRLLVNWVFLMEHHEAPSNVLGDVIKEVNATYEKVLTDFKLK